MIKYISLKISISFVFWLSVAIVLALALEIPILFGYPDRILAGEKIQSPIKYFDITLFWGTVSSALFIFLVYWVIKEVGDMMRENFPRLVGLFKSPHVIDDKEFKTAIHDEVLGQVITIGSIVLVASLISVIDNSIGNKIIKPIGISHNDGFKMGGLCYLFSIGWVLVCYNKHIKP